MSEESNTNTQAMLGAEVYGVEPVFTSAKWKDSGCADWALDEQFVKDYPREGKQYVRDVRRKGKVCMLCLWNDGDECCHEQATVESDMSEFR